MEFLKHTLPNGLEIVAECNAEVHSAALGFFVRTGARDETDDVAGVSHFLEHMVFKGTPTRSADDVNREFDEIGAHYNAFTGEEATVYYAAILPEYVEKTVELWSDVLRPSLRTEDFDTEKQVILEEIQMYEDQPPFGADDRCKALHYAGHPLGRSVLGTAESVAGLPVDKMRAYFERRYSPANIVLAAAGRIDFEGLAAAAERFCGAWQPFAAGRVPEAVRPREDFLVVCKPTATQQYALSLSQGPSAEDPRRYAAKLLTTVIGDDAGSRFYWELTDPGLAEQASLNHYEYEGSGAYYTYMSCDPERAVENLQRILDIYRQAESEGITAEELAQAKSKVSSRVVLSGERPRGRLFAIGSDWLQRGDYHSVKEELVAFSGVSLDEVNALLAAYPLSRMTTVTSGPLAEVARPQ